MFTTLNIVIGLVFVLLLFSLLASTIMEVIAALLSLRAKNLRNSLENMLGAKMDDFVRHPLFRQIAFASDQRNRRISSYYLPNHISKETFITIVQDIMDAGNRDALSAKIQTMEDGEPKRMMQFILRYAGGDIKEFQAQAERWFDEVMSRSLDWYKRNLKWWLFAIGLVLAGIFNADTIQIYQNISASAVTQKFLTEMAANYADNTDTVTAIQLDLSLEASIARLDSALQKIEYIHSPLGLGWNASVYKFTAYMWLVKLLGLILTGIAVTMGAPFWFDLLKKMLALRGGSDKPADKPEPQVPVGPPNPNIAPDPRIQPSPENEDAGAILDPGHFNVQIPQDQPRVEPFDRSKAVG